MTNRHLNPVRRQIALGLMLFGMLAFVVGGVAKEFGWVYGGIQMGFLGIVVGLVRYVCPKCGLKNNGVVVEIKHCHTCGASLCDRTDTTNSPA